MTTHGKNNTVLCWSCDLKRNYNHLLSSSNHCTKFGYSQLLSSKEVKIKWTKFVHISTVWPWPLPTWSVGKIYSLRTGNVPSLALSSRNFKRYLVKALGLQTDRSTNWCKTILSSFLRGKRDKNNPPFDQLVQNNTFLVFKREKG